MKTGFLLHASVIGLAMLLGFSRHTPAAAATNSPTWTIMIYGHGDHNLADSLVDDMHTMETLGSGPGFNIIIQTDFDASQADDLEAAGLPPKLAAGTTRFIVTKAANPEKIGSKVLARLPEMNHDDPGTLADFIAWAAKAYPADRYGLILWDHGGQWEGFGGDTQDGTLDKTGTMIPGQIHDALTRSMKAAGIVQWDFIAFDTCLMAGAEVLAEMAGLTPLFIACPEIDFGDGWDYPASLGWLKNHSVTTMREFGLQEAAFWKQRHIQEDKPADQVLAGHSVFDLMQYGEFESAFRRFTETLCAEARPEKIHVPRQRRQTTEYSIPDLLDLGDPTEYADLGEFAQRLAEDSQASPELAATARSLIRAIDSMVLARVQGSAKTATHGLSVWYPVNGWGNVEEEPDEVEESDDQNGQEADSSDSDDQKSPPENLREKREKFSQYEETSFAKRTGWSKFLDRMHDLSLAGATSPPVIEIRGAVTGELQLSQSKPLHLPLEITRGRGAFVITAGLMDPALTKKAREFAYLGEVAVLPANGEGRYMLDWDLRVPCFANSDGKPVACLGGAFLSNSSEAPRGPDSKRSGRGIFAESCEATEDSPAGNLFRPRGYDLPSPAEAGYAKAGGQEPQGVLAKKDGLMVSYAKYKRGPLSRSKDVILITRISGKSGTILEVLEEENEDTAPTSMEVEPGGVFKPVYHVERRRGPDAEKWTQHSFVVRTPIVIPEGGASAIPIVMALRNPGPCLIEIEAEDIYGNHSVPVSCPVRIIR